MQRYTNLTWALPLLIVALFTGCNSISPAASSTSTASAVIVPTTASLTTLPPEQLLPWQQVQAVLAADVAVLVPTWLPAQLGTVQPTIGDVDRTLYSMIYTPQPRQNLFLTSGQAALEAPGGIPYDRTEAITVRGVTGTLLSRDTEQKLRWQEGQQTYGIVASNLVLSQDDLLRIASSLTPLPLSPRQSADAWTRVRAVLPTDVTVYQPTWLPEGYGPAELVAATSSDGASSYTILSRASQTNMIVFVLGAGYGSWGNFPPPDSQEKVTVLGQEANFVTALDNQTMSISWTAQRRSYHVRASGAITKDELLRIANSLVPVPASTSTPTP